MLLLSRALFFHLFSGSYPPSFFFQDLYSYLPGILYFLPFQISFYQIIPISDKYLKTTASFYFFIHFSVPLYSKLLERVCTQHQATQHHYKYLCCQTSQQASIIYIDSSAFDTNNHFLLLERFNSVGFVVTTLNWPLFPILRLIFSPKSVSLCSRLIFFFK